MNRRQLILGGGALLGAAAWFWFRPELLFLHATVQESFPADQQGQETVLARGEFHGVAHETRGTATLYQLPQGRRLLRFTSFETSNGPDVRVLLIAADDANDSDTVRSADSVELGPLKGSRGDQNYEVPADLDLARYRAVTVWCHRFSVNFAAAPLR